MIGVTEKEALRREGMVMCRRNMKMRSRILKLMRYFTIFDGSNVVMFRFTNS